MKRGEGEGKPLYARWVGTMNGRFAGRLSRASGDRPWLGLFFFILCIPVLFLFLIFTSTLPPPSPSPSPSFPPPLSLPLYPSSSIPLSDETEVNKWPFTISFWGNLPWLLCDLIFFCLSIFSYFFLFLTLLWLNFSPPFFPILYLFFYSFSFPYIVIFCFSFSFSLLLLYFFLLSLFSSSRSLLVRFLGMD